MAFKVSNQQFTSRTHTALYNEDGSMRSIEYEENVYIHDEEPCDDNQVYIDIGVDIAKAREDEGLVSGWANISINKDGSLPLDWQDDIIAPETLEKAAIQFMLDYRDSGVMHDGKPPIGTVVESIMFTKEKQEALGIPEGILPQGWFITVKVNDPEVFAKVKDGTYKMFSIQGTCKRVQV